MLRNRFVLIPALVAASLALPAAAEDAHHPPADAGKPHAMQPGMQGPGGMMGNMMQMMQQMMSGMRSSGDMQRMRMMSMSGTPTMGAMQGPAVERVEGHIAFLKAELKIASPQEQAWNNYAAALRANAKQLNELSAAQAKAPASATPVDRLAQQEKVLAARLEIVRRTQPALAALYAAFTDDQKKTFDELSMPRRAMGMQ